MKCNACGNDKAIRIKVYYEGKERKECCEICGSLPQKTFYDVWCPAGGYFDEHLADRHHPDGQYVKSKEHKANILRGLNLRESGSDINKVLGRPMPYIADRNKRRQFMRDNFGE